MDLSTTYLGLRLPHPFMAGASPLVDHLDTVRRLEDAGSAAIVMRSLFEEQISMAETGKIHHMRSARGGFRRETRGFSAAGSLHAMGPTSTWSNCDGSKRR